MKLDGGNLSIGNTNSNTIVTINEGGSVISGGNAINGSTMKGLTSRDTNNTNSSLGLWFGTNGTHWSGISGQRTDSASTWGTHLAFYTHEDATNDLTYTRERMRISSAGNVGIGTTSPTDPLTIHNGTPSIAFKDTSSNGTMAFTLDGTTLSLFNKSTGGVFTFGTANTERMRIDGSGSFEFNTTANLGARYFIVNQASGSDGGFIMRVGNSNKWQNSFSSAGELQWYSYTANATVYKLLGSGVIQSPPTYAQTTSNAANMVVRSSGDFERSTSSKRYKNSITDVTKGLSELKTLRPVNYKGNNDGETVFYGLIAEEVHDAGLTEFVEYNDENQPDGLRYPHMVSLCIKAIQEQQEQIDELKAKLENR